MRYALPLAAALLFTGCDHATRTPQAVKPELIGWFAAGRPAHVIPNPNETIAEMRAHLDAFKVESKAIDQLQHAGNWQNADRQAREMLEHPAPLEQYLREQIVADRMLKHWLDIEDPPAEQLPAIAFYTELLLQNRSPMGHIVERALQVLEGHWPAERLAEGARVASEAAQAYLLKEGVNLREGAGDGDPLRDSGKRVHVELAAAVHRLDAIAEKG